MNLFFVVLGFMAVFVGLMAIGLLLGRKPIAGTCGGMANLGMETACDVCGGDKEKCEKESTKVAQANKGSDLAYDAAKK